MTQMTLFGACNLRMSLLHAICGATGLRFDKVKSQCLFFIKTNVKEFRNILPQNWHTQISQYIIQRIWNSDLVDILPYILSIMLRQTIRVLSAEGNTTRVSKFSTEYGNPICLILSSGHFKYVDYKYTTNKVNLDGSFAVGENNTKPLPVDTPVINHKKPTIVLNYKSETATTKINGFKHSLTSGELFNVMFKSTTRLIDLVKRVNNTKVKSTDKLKCGQVITDEQAVSAYGAIYIAQCKECKKQNIRSLYIGESGRDLRTRIREHCSPIKEKHDVNKVSAVGIHSMEKHGEQPSRVSWDFTILKFSQKTQYRRAFEAVAIAQIKPELNRDRGVQILPLTAGPDMRETINFKF